MASKIALLPIAAALASIGVMTAAPIASAADTCFTDFSGSIHVQFKGKITSPGYHPLTGVTFGALSSCAGLTHWPLVGAAYTESGSIVVAFRAMTVDASGCGAVDEIANLTPSTLTGPLQLHNDRTNFSNSDTLTASTCATPPPVGSSIRKPGGRDSAGN